MLVEAKREVWKRWRQRKGKDDYNHYKKLKRFRQRKRTRKKTRKSGKRGENMRKKLRKNQKKLKTRQKDWRERNAQKNIGKC